MALQEVTWVCIRTIAARTGPNVNMRFSVVSAGDETKDLGQIPAPRTWWLKLSLGN